MNYKELKKMNFDIEKLNFLINGLKEFSTDSLLEEIENSGNFIKTNIKFNEHNELEKISPNRFYHYH